MVYFVDNVFNHFMKYKKTAMTEVMLLIRIRFEDLRYCSGVDNESVQLCGGNECIRSSTACHLIIPFKGYVSCGGYHNAHRYNSHEQANSIKNVCFSCRQHSGLRISPVGCYTLHGSLTSPYKAGFLTSASLLPFPFSYICTMGL